MTKSLKNLNQGLFNASPVNLAYDGAAYITDQGVFYFTFLFTFLGRYVSGIKVGDAKVRRRFAVRAYRFVIHG
jgi:hypothetical protein